MHIKRIIIAVLTLFVFSSVAVGCTIANAKSDEFTVCRNGGPFDNNNIRSILPPGEHSNNEGVSTTCYSFPANTRIYTASGDRGADGRSLSCTTSDAVQMKIAVSVRFTLNTESNEIIRKEFNEVLSRYEAWDDTGWDNMLRDTIRRELDARVEQLCRQHTGRDLATGEDALSEVRDALKDGLGNDINDNVGVRLFCGPGVPYGSDDCPPLNVSVTRIVAAEAQTRDAFESLVREEAETRAAEQRIQTADAEAQAIEAQAQAAAEAGGNYVNLQLIQMCAEHPDACPTLWVLPSDGGVTVTNPAP